MPLDALGETRVLFDFVPAGTAAVEAEDALACPLRVLRDIGGHTMAMAKTNGLQRKFEKM